MAATAVLAAERHRSRTGEGQLVRLALKDVALATAGHLGNLAEVEINGSDRQKAGNFLYGAFGKDFLTIDGRRVMIVGLTPKQWRALITVTGSSDEMDRIAAKTNLDLSEEGARFTARHEIASVLAPWFEARSYHQVAELLTKAGVCFGPYQSFRQLLTEDVDCSTDNPLFERVTHPATGTYLTPSSPIRFGLSDNLKSLPAPKLGEHTDQILAEVLGLSSPEIGRLHDEGIVRQSS